MIKLPFLYVKLLDISTLKSSLAVTLARFPTFSGRLATTDDGTYAIAYPSTALFTTAKIDTPLTHFLPSKPSPLSSVVEMDNLDKLFPCSAPKTVLGYKRADAALLQVQVTHFKGGGTSLCLVVPHIIADQESCRVFVSAWAAEYSSKAAAMALNKAAECAMVADVLKPYYSLKGGESQRSQENLHEYESERFERRSWKFVPGLLATAIRSQITSGSPVTIAYHVPASRLKELKSKAMDMAAKGSESEWVSTNDALVGRLQQAFDQVFSDGGGSSSGNNKKSIHLVVDLRKRVDPPLPAPAFGNASWTVNIPSPPREPGNETETALALYATGIRDKIKSIQCTIELRNDIVQDLRWMEAVASKYKHASTLPIVFRGFYQLFLPNSPVLLVSNWDWGGNGYEDVKFGDSGAPVWHHPGMQVHLPTTAYIVPIAGAIHGGGALVYMTLHKKTAQKFIKRIKSL